MSGNLPRMTWRRLAVIGSIAILVVAALVFEYRRTAPIRASVQVLSELISAGHLGDPQSARQHCSSAFLDQHGLRVAPEGGLIGLPRTIDKSFRVWREGKVILLCPSGRDGVVFRFIQEDRRWKFDGPAGFLRGGREFEQMSPSY